MSIPAEQSSRRLRPAPSATPSSRASWRVRASSARRPRIAVFRALALGDLLCAVPAFRALRGANPDAEITLIGLPWARSFVERFGGYLDRFVEFPGFPGIPEVALDPRRLATFLETEQAERYDLAIQLQGNGLHSNGFVRLLGAARTAGYYLPAAGCPDPESFAPYPGHGPEIRRHLALMEFLGFPARGEHLEFPLGDLDQRTAAKLARDLGLRPAEYVMIHPGASIAPRRWPPERFAEVADCLAEIGLRVVVTGTEPERPITAATLAAMRPDLRARAVDLTGRTELGTYAALLDLAALLVSNDTSVAHVASALQVPSVVIFLGSERDRWAALDGTLHLAVGQGSRVGCRNHGDDEHRCLRDACAFPRPDDVPVDVSVDEVRAAVLRQVRLASRRRAEATVSMPPSEGTSDAA